MCIIALLGDVAKALAVDAVVRAGKLALKAVEILSGARGRETLKNHVTVIIDFNQYSIEEHVKNYLAVSGIDSTVFVCVNSEGRVHMDINNRDKWHNAVKELYTFISAISNAAPERINIFINAPATLMFALGYTLRPICQPYIYQYNPSREGTSNRDLYSMVLHVNDNLKG